MSTYFLQCEGVVEEFEELLQEVLSVESSSPSRIKEEFCVNKSRLCSNDLIRDEL